MSTVPVKSLVATIRATQDIWCRRRDDDGTIISQVLFPSAALQLWDHHLHTSGLIPRVFSVSNQTPVIYEQDWACSYESVTCFPQEGLIELTVEDGGSAQSHVWVDRVGASTLYLGQLITLYDQVLATAVRVLSRKLPTTSWSEQLHPAGYHQPVAAPFTDLERDYYEANCAADDIFFDYQGQLLEKYREEDEGDAVATMDADTKGDGDRETKDDTSENGAGEKDTEMENGEHESHENSGKDDRSISTDKGEDTDENDDQNTSRLESEGSGTDVASPAMPNKSTKRPTAGSSKKRKLTLSSTLSLETFGTFLPRLHGKHLMTVQVGPQHLDSVSGGDGRFADTTWLAEVAFQALALAAQQLLIQPPCESTKSAGSCSLAVRHRSVAMLGNELHCSLHGDRLCMVRSAMTELGEIEGNEIVVLVAKTEIL